LLCEFTSTRERSSTSPFFFSQANATTSTLSPWTLKSTLKDGNPNPTYHLVFFLLHAMIKDGGNISHEYLLASGLADDA